jgi:hypothetical protein
VSQDTFNVYRAIRDVVAAERGRFFFDREGKAVFWNRHHLMKKYIVDATFDNTMTDLEYSFAGLDHFKNEIIVTCHPRAIGASSSEVLWSLDDEVRIPADSSRTVWARYEDGSGNRIGAKDVSVTDVTFSEGTATVTLDARANSAQLQITNSGSETAVMTSCIVRGKKITDYGQMKAAESDGESMAKYGRRTMNLNLPSVDNYEDARRIARFELHRRKDPLGTVSRLTLVSHGTEGGGSHAQQLARTIGDLVTVEEAQTAHESNYHIIGETHELSDGATLLKTTWYLEPSPDMYPWWILGVSGRSELGQTTYLGY